MREHNNAGHRINDVAINSHGGYVIINNGYGYNCANVPEKLLTHLQQRNAAHDNILSVSIDDNNSWAFVSKDRYGASDETDMKLMRTAEEKCGEVYSVAITAKGIVICCANGVLFQGLPKRVADSILNFVESGNKLRVVKYTDAGTFFLTDGDKAYRFYM
jgi:hypothetical protein